MRPSGPERPAKEHLRGSGPGRAAVRTGGAGCGAWRGPRGAGADLGLWCRSHLRRRHALPVRVPLAAAAGAPGACPQHPVPDAAEGCQRRGLHQLPRQRGLQVSLGGVRHAGRRNACAPHSGPEAKRLPARAANERTGRASRGGPRRADEPQPTCAPSPQPAMPRQSKQSPVVLTQADGAALHVTGTRRLCCLPDAAGATLPGPGCPREALSTPWMRVVPPPDPALRSHSPGAARGPGASKGCAEGVGWS